MPVEFEEENFAFDTQNTAAARYKSKAQEINTPLMKATMIIFAIACVALAFYVPSFINPHKETSVVYVEDLTEARMRLLPKDQANDIISRLPSRNAQ